MMTPKVVERVEAELDRCIEAIRELNKYAGKFDPHGKMVGYEYGRYTGAVRRASLDLTRALADLRRR